MGIPRALGEERDAWSAITARVRHPGVLLANGLKLTHRLPQALASDEARDAGCDEALMFDAEGRLVEGSRSNVVIVSDQGTPTTPPEARGAVSGIALGLLREALPDLESRDLTQADVARAELVLCVNAVRGAKPVTTLDGQPVGAVRHDFLDRCRDVLEGDAASRPG